MTYEAIILSAAKKAGVSFSLLFAICSHESNHFTDIYVHDDGGTPSVGICMVKEETAAQLGYKGTLKKLETDHKLNAKYAAKYLKYQQDRYGDNWCKIAAAYNAGSFIERKKKPGHPVNEKYLKLIEKFLSDDDKKLLECKN